MQTREETQRGVKKCNSVNKTISFLKRQEEEGRTKQFNQKEVQSEEDERRNPINLSFDDAFEKERRRRRNRIQEQMKQ